MTNQTRDKAGQPAKYENPEDLQIAIDGYFDACKAGGTDTPPTITGLALSLGFADRQSLIDYAGRPQFSCTIKKAKARVEAYLETSLYSGSVAGVIFNLKNNFGWKDKHETEHSGSVQFSGLMTELYGNDKPQD